MVVKLFEHRVKLPIIILSKFSFNYEKYFRRPSILKCLVYVDIALSRHMFHS